MTQQKWLPRMVALTVVLCLISGAPAVAEWNWTVIPYLWTSDIGLDLVTPVGEGGTDIAFGDLIDKLDFAFQVHAEGRRVKGGIHFDFTFIDISDEKESTGGGPLPLPGGTSAVTGVKILIVEGGGLYQLAGSEKRRLDVIYGVRYIDLDTRFDITLPLPPAPTTRVDTRPFRRAPFHDPAISLVHRDP